MSRYLCVARSVALVGVLVAIASVAVGSGRTAGSARARWVLTDLGRASLAAINDHGQIVGTSYFGHILLWQKGKMVDLGTLGMRETTARDINNSGQIIGSAWTAKGDAWRAFL
jgi:probable HAF family extracellular repeat protein